MLMQHYSQEPKGGNNLSVHQQMNKNVYIPHNGVLFNHKKECALIYATTWMNLEKIMQSVNPDIKGQIFHDSIHIEHLVYSKKVE
jgi:hypothetical protein